MSGGGGDQRRRARVGEVAGGTAAECAAVCCCCPLTVMNVVLMVVYKVPTGLCRRVKNQRRRREKAASLSHKNTFKKALLHHDSDRSTLAFDDVAKISTVVSFDGQDEFDSHVWDQFRGAGFWRSPSQREN